VEAITSYYQPTPISEDLIAPWVTQVNACVALADLQRPPTQSVDLWVRNYPDTLSVEDVMIQLIDAEVVSPTGAVLGIRVSPNAEFSGTVFSPMWQRIQTVALPVTGNMADRLRQNLGDLLMVSQRRDHRIVTVKSEKVLFFWIIPIWTVARKEWTDCNDFRPQWVPTFDPMKGYRTPPVSQDVSPFWGNPRSGEFEVLGSRASAYRHVGVEFRQKEKPSLFLGWGSVGLLDWGAGVDRVWDSETSVSLANINLGGSLTGEWGEIHADIGPSVQFGVASALGYSTGFRIVSPSTDLAWVPVGIASYRRYESDRFSDGSVLWGVSQVALSVRWTLDGWFVSVGKEFLSGQELAVGDGVFMTVGGQW
jgi:hypothetical protein